MVPSQRNGWGSVEIVGGGGRLQRIAPVLLEQLSPQHGHLWQQMVGYLHAVSDISIEPRSG
jgi:hypothetical protein